MNDKKRWLFGTLFLLIGFALGAWFFSGVLNPRRPAYSTLPVYASGVPAGEPSDFSTTAEKVTPGVVKILSEGFMETESRSGGTPFGEDDLFGDFWRRFFSVPQQRNVPVQGFGSGFFISADGYIVTNNHVVEKAQKVTVSTFDGNEYKAKIVGTDPKTDLARLKVEGKSCPFLPLGDSSTVRVGEWVLAVGNPLQTEFTVTAGIISAKGRQLDTAEYADYIQTDAAINRGNSGGPLVNLRGEVIGVNSVILSPNQGSVGIGFAIPSNIVKTIVTALKGSGKVERGYMGVSIQDIGPADKEALGLASTTGALIAQVVPGGPADTAGLKAYDVVVKCNSEPIKNATALKLKIGSTKPGQVVTLGVLRDGKSRDISIKVSKLGDKGDESLPADKGDAVSNVSEELGLTLTALTSKVAENYGIPYKGGLLIMDVKPLSPAYDAGLQKGLIIVEANRTKVDTLQDLNRVVAAAKSRGAVLFRLVAFDNSGSKIELLRSLRLR